MKAYHDLTARERLRIYRSWVNAMRALNSLERSIVWDAIIKYYSMVLKAC